MKYEFYQLTSVGNRKSNQDYMARIIEDDYALFLVADGLGGHQAGERASLYFCQGMMFHAQKFSHKMQLDPQQTMIDWIDAAIDKMLDYFEGDRVAYKAHTTCALLYLQEGMTVAAHCGDSRIYRMNPKQTLWRSRDHSVTQGLLEEGALNEQQMGVHPEQNQITRSINVKKTFEPEINVYPGAEPGETFILCSDGFWEFTKPHEFQKLANLDSNKKDLVKQAQLAVFRAEGNSDNVTVQWVRVLN